MTLYLSRFNFLLKHVPGSKMEKADGSSRRSNWEGGVKGDNEEKTLVMPVSQTSFRPISTNTGSFSTISVALESPQEELSNDAREPSTP